MSKKKIPYVADQFSTTLPVNINDSHNEIKALRRQQKELLKLLKSCQSAMSQFDKTLKTMFESKEDYFAYCLKNLDVQIDYDSTDLDAFLAENEP